MIVGLSESGCCSCNILESCLQRNEIRSRKKLITCQVTKEKITQDRAATNKSSQMVIFPLVLIFLQQLFSVSRSMKKRIIKLRLFYPELCNKYGNEQCHSKSICISGACSFFLTMDQVIKSRRLWNFVESFFQTLFP